MTTINPYQERDPGEISHAYPTDPPQEGVDYVVDVVNSFSNSDDGSPKQMTIRKFRP